MSDLEALYLFLNKPVSSDMIQFLVATTTSIIKVPSSSASSDYGYLTPPSSPTEDQSMSTTVPPLTHFIKRLIHHSHVQTPTLMSSLIYLNKLKMVIPSNSQGIETTHHRIFLGALILAAKYTNDSSPMNKHWTKYTDGLLSLNEINALERELINFIGWDNLRFSNSDLMKCLSYFLVPIKKSLTAKCESTIQSRFPNVMTIENDDHKINIDESYNKEEMSISPSMPSLMSSSSISTIATYMSSKTPTSSSLSLSSHINLSGGDNTSNLTKSKSNELLNIKLKPLRLPSNSNLNSSSLKTSKSSVKLSLNIPLTDLSNSYDILPSY